MEVDERLRWFETRVTSSLKPRAEELKNLFSNEESRRCLLEFCNNEEARQIFIYYVVERSRTLIASPRAASTLKSKALLFIKSQSAGKITRDNANTDIFYCACSQNVVQHLEILAKEIFLPLLSIEQTGGASADKLMDLVHRLISSLQIINGNIEGEVNLPLPSIEVLSEAAAYSHRKLVVIHILETYLIGWIKQIKNSLKLDPEMEITRRNGKLLGPLCEAEAWANHFEKIRRINEQLCSPVVVNILTNLEEANSTYAQSFHNVKREISKAEMEADENLQFLSTMTQWFQTLTHSEYASDMMSNFAPLMHTLYLVWQHSRYYHATNNLTRLLRMISNEVVKRARDLLDFSILDDLISAHSNLKEALQICASFRGRYLDTKDKADALNHQKLAEQIGTRTDSSGVVWHSRMFREAKTQRGTTVFGKEKDQRSENDISSAMTWDDSPWPARNSSVFAGLNSFMERCNDVLELVETTRHFRMLRNAAEVGGAGGHGLDAMVREIHEKFEIAMVQFKKTVKDVLDVDHSQQFERSFFVFRSVIRELETRLGGVLHESFKQCWDIRSRLRLLEVFEGTSSRDLVQKEIKLVVDNFVPNLTDDIVKTRSLLENGISVYHHHIPPLANELLWLVSLKARLQVTIEKLKLVSPSSLKGDEGWKVRDTFSDLIKDIEKMEKSLFDKWKSTIGADLMFRLKQPLLVSQDAEDGARRLNVNIDDQLREMLKEVRYLQLPPLELRLPDEIRTLIRNTDPALLQTNAARLSTVVSQYNSVITTVNEIERPLFEIKMANVEQLLQEGLEKYTWHDVESTDFIERATNLVCNDVFKNVSIVRSNLNEITRISQSWSVGDLDAFGIVGDNESLYIDELHSQQRECSIALCHLIEIGGKRIHNLLKSTFEAVQISRASPVWLRYTEYVSSIVYDGLRKSILSSLRSMLHRIESSSKAEPILAIKLELVASEISFTPPLTKSLAAKSLQEYVDIWLNDYISRASFVSPICQNEDFNEMVKQDFEIADLTDNINNIVVEKIELCKKYLETFKDYAFLWMQDVKLTFEEFLKGNISSRASAPSRLEDVKSSLSNSSKKDKDTQKGSSRASSAVTALNSTTMGTVSLSEKTMLAVKRLKLSKEDNAPSLDDFDREMEVYRVSRDEIHAVTEHCKVGWIMVNMQPIKKTIETYASKWVFTFTKYLTDQVSSALSDLDAFLKRIEPGVEAITGEERDIISFMRLMRIFNEVTAQQTELDTKFATMKRTLSLLEKYEQKLPETTQKFYAAAPLRWNNLKMKVNQAKQRLGPRIQADAANVTKTLQKFGERCLQLDYDFRASEAFNRSCRIYTAHNIMDSIEKSLNIIEGEAQDLVELQELLEEEVVDFSILPSLRSDLGVLRQVWETAKLIQEQQSDWKRHRWQKIRPKLLRKLLGQQEELLKQLPEKAAGWDVTNGIQQSIQKMLACVPIMEDLSKAAMRTRHWKQLVRATGGAVNISSDGLTKMTLGQFMDLGLQNHADEVRGVIQRAAKDVGIEKALKTYEEVWLSKMFELVKHTRLSAGSSNVVPAHDTPASEYGNDSELGVSGIQRPSGSRVSLASLGLRTESRLRSTSFISATSMRQSVVMFMEQGEVLLLNNIEPILEELELHQMSLQSMLGGTAASSFADDIVKWQKTLQNLEAVLNLWWEAQQKWIKLDDMYNGTECRVALPRETNLFALSSNDFKGILKLAEKNPNVLQICSREDILPRLEKINLNFETCLKALFGQLERRKQKFPRLYLMSQEEVLNIVCKGYDPGQINPYLSRIIRNACVMDYEVQESEDKKFYRVTGIRSVHGEILKFIKPVDCDYMVENWLNSLITTIKSTLQVSLASALGMPLPEGIKFGMTSSRELTSPGKEESKAKKSPSPQQRKVLFAEEPEIVGDLEDTAREEMSLPSSWSLRNINEIVILALQVELTQKFEKCFEDFQSGNKAALLDIHQHLSAILDSAAGLLQGAGESDPVHEVFHKKEKSKIEPDSRQYESNDEAENQRKIEDIPIRGDARIILSPSQMQKLTNLIFVLSAKRDLAKKFSEIANSTDQNDNEKEGKMSLAKTFEWHSQMKYYWSQPNSSCRISVMGSECDYGFEYQGTTARMVITPETERSLFWLTQGILSQTPCLLVGSTVSGRNEILLELSNAFGYPAYQFICSENISTNRIGDIFKGIATTGSWAIFSSLNKLSSSAISVITQLISKVFESIKAKKSTFTMHDDELMLSSNAKVFACMDLNSKMAISESRLLFPNISSSLYCVPAGLLAKFRTVCLSPPDIHSVLKMHLIVHGFSFADELATNLTSIYSIWSRLAMIKTIPSLRVFCSLINDAGDYLDELKVKEIEGFYQESRNKKKSEFAAEDSPSPPASPTEAMLIANSPDKNEEMKLEDDANGQNLSDSVCSNHSNDESILLSEVDLKSLEQKSIVLSLRSHVTPSLTGADAVMFATMLSDYFPSLDVPLIFNEGHQDINEFSFTEETIGLSIEKEKGAPLNSLPSSPQPKDQAISDLESAIRIAVQRIDLQPGHSFVSRVMQLSHLVSSNRTVIIVGPAGCGKTESIRTLIAAQREMGRNVIYNSMFLGTAESEELFGYYSKAKKEWIDGFMPSVLRRKLHDMCKNEIGIGQSDSQDLRWIHLDGLGESSQIEALSEVLTGSDDLTLPNSERLHLPSTVRFIWEVETLDNIPPTLLAGCGILKLNQDDVGWRLVLQNWLAKQSDTNREKLTGLCKRYINTSMDFLIHERIIRSDFKTSKSIVGYHHSHGQLQHAVSLTEANMVQTLISIFEALIFNAQDPTHECFESYFNFAAFWAFGGNLLDEYREHFSCWWRRKWSKFVIYPEDVSLWQCYVHPETHEFVHAAAYLPSYSGKPNSSFPPDAHVATAQNMVVSHLISVLTENGKPTLLVGPSGCGKSHIIKDRLLSQSSDMAEVQSLFINANKFITSKALWQRMDEFLEWKHTKTYVPKGNKRLICLIDDLNHSNANKSRNQSACETVRQLLDHDGSFYNDGWKWRQVQDVTYLATYNPWTTVSSPKLSPRLLNKWIVLYLPFPSQDEQCEIYTTLVKTHFILPPPQSSNQEANAEFLSSEMIRKKANEEAMRKLIESIVAITVEVQESLRSMFLPTPSRSHYIFTLNNLGIIFRNICLVLTSSCTQDDLITSWKHECENVYGTVLMDNVDKGRWMQIFNTAARKRLDKDQLEILTKPSCLISNLIDVDDSLKKGAKGSKNSNDSEEQVVSYKPSNDLSKAKAILEHNIHEYNKDNPKVKIYLYEETVRTICRLIRILQSPHECGHAMILANGFPGLPLPLVKIAAYICGFTVFQIQPSMLVLGEKYTIEHFKLDIVNAYTTAGLKGEKLLFVLNEIELFEEDFLVYITEFLVSNSISHLFNEEEHTSITNAIRTEVTQAGLNYTKETAWNFFLRAVRENLRFVFIVSAMEEIFQNRCRQFPSMINAMQIVSLPLWDKEELVMIASYHLKDMAIFDDTEKENIAHLLASMHLAVAESDGAGKKSGKFSHVTNTTFERFVEHFVDMAYKRHAEIEKEYETMAKTLEAIDQGTELATELGSQLDHEKIVLEQKKQGNFTLLSQIGQDKAITEEQVRLVKKQQWKIEHLERLLPRYQDAHERAVFKAAAMVKETKQILAELEQQGLSDLRSMQKPDSDIEDVLAAVIIIVKSPTSDLTWNKGAKRIMANLERFREELAAFDEVEMTEDTLQVVEPYIKRPHFATGYMEKKTSNAALESLVSWVCGVVKYHRMMLSRVKPLHKMVEQTTRSLEEAVEKLGSMQSKLKNLDDRMISLSGKFEDASVDKSRQGLLTESQHHQLSRAAYFEKLLFAGRQQWTRVLESIAHRKQSMVGNIAISVGFATYLGFYNHEFRQYMTEKVWPGCLAERGILAEIRVADNLTVDITLSMAKIDTKAFVKNLEESESNVEGSQVDMSPETEENDDENVAAEEGLEDEKTSETLEEKKEMKSGEEIVSHESSESEGKKQLKEVQGMLSSGGHSMFAFDQYMIAVVKLLTGFELERSWTSKGMNYRQLENAALFVSSIQTPLLLIDPCNLAMGLFSIIGNELVKVDMSQRGATILNTIERAVTLGETLLVYNMTDDIDSFFFPIIEHINTKCRLNLDQEPSVIKMNGRRLMIHPSFQLIMVHSSPFPNIPDQLASTTTVVDLRPNTNGIIRYFLLRGIERLIPQLHNEDSRVYFELSQCYDTLEKLDNTCMALIRGKEGSGMWEQTEVITNLVKKRTQMAERFSKVILCLQHLQIHRAKFIPLAQCVLSAFHILVSLGELRNEYQFPFDLLVAIFDKATKKESTVLPSRMVYSKAGGSKKGGNLSLSRGKEERALKNTSELLGVNLEKIQNSLKNEGKDFADLKGTRSSQRVASDLETEGNIDLPETIELNVPDSIENIEEEITETCRKFFAIFYQNAAKSLSSDHLELFTLLCWIRMEAVNFSPPDRDKIKMLLDQDFLGDNSTANFNAPSWIPKRNWELLVTMSSSEPVLREMIQSIETIPDKWEEWYTTASPEDHPLPSINSHPQLDEAGNTEPESQSLNNDVQSKNSSKQTNEIIRLLLIKCLRPDRFQAALTKLCRFDLSETLNQPIKNLKDLFPDLGKEMPVLILMPSSTAWTECDDHDEAACSELVFKVLKSKAEENDSSLTRVSLFDGNERQVELSLNNAMSNEEWILIENMHLGNANWLKIFTRRLLRLYDQPDEGRRWKLFMTSEPWEQFPLHLLYVCEKISYDVLMSKNEPCSPRQSLVVRNIVKSIKHVGEKTWSNSQERSLIHRDLLYALCVGHGMMLTREEFSPRTVTVKSRIIMEDLLVAMDFATKYFETKEMGINLSLKDVCHVICENIYCNKAVSDVDKKYIRMIFKSISDGLSSNLGSSIQFGDWSVPVPPANVDPLDYSRWCMEKLSAVGEHDCTLAAMQLHETAGREQRRQSSDAFVSDLKLLFERSMQEPFACAAKSDLSTQSLKLRHAVDMCKDRLPSLLKTDEYFGMTASQMISNPQLRSLTPFSEKSLRLSQKEELPPATSYCLLKECEWLNNLLFNVSSTVQELDQLLVSGSHAVQSLETSITHSLSNGKVPKGWSNFFAGASLHTLNEWLDRVCQAHSQLNAWLKQGLVPKPSSEPTIGRGKLELVDLSLLRNPEGFMSAMKYTRAVTDGLSIQKVALKGIFSKNVNKFPTLPEGKKLSDGVVLKNLFLDGASWDVEKSCIAGQSNNVRRLPLAFISAENKANIDEGSYFNCPVFANRCRQKPLFELHLPIANPEERHAFLFNGTYIMLDPTPEAV